MHRFSLFALVICVAIASPAQNLAFVTTSLPTAMIEKPYDFRIQATGGTVPLKFHIGQGTLPPGLNLDPRTGTINGTPQKAGLYTFRISVLDSAGQSTAKTYTIEVSDALIAQWKKPPVLDSNTISGSVEVSNGTKDKFDLTVIVVAVNEIGKAFALGYQHFDLASNAKQTIPFSSTLPNGRYMVHGDVVAEVPARRRIHRVHLQTERALVVNANR